MYFLRIRLSLFFFHCVNKGEHSWAEGMGGRQRTGAVVSAADYGPRALKGSLVPDLAGSPSVVALSKSHLPPA